VSHEADALREINERFYQALERLDLEAMEAIWLHEGWVRCIHPGRDALIGWSSIRRSWEQIFGGTGWIRVTTTDVEVVSMGSHGLVTCAENISAQSHDQIGVAVAQATNVYRKTADGWRMIHHHASPAPVELTEPFSGTAS